jgi:hypothetical protein
MASAQNAHNIELSAFFAGFVRKLGETINRIAADEADRYRVHYLEELTVALPKVLAVSATAQDDVQHHHYQAESARNDIAFDIDDAMEMVMAAAATGKVDWKVSSAHKAREVIHGFAEVVEKMAATAATKETALATSCQVEEEYVDHQITLKAVDIMAAAQNAVTYQTIEEAGFAAYVRLLREKIDKTAADETDQDVLNALAELSEALPRMLAASATAEDVMPHHQAERARIYFAFDIDEAMNMIATAAATGNVDYEVRSARKAIQHIEDFAEVVQEMAEMATVLVEEEEEEEENVNDKVLSNEVDMMAAVQNADNEQTANEAGFAAYVRVLGETIDKAAADETNTVVLDALAELREALPKMLAASATAEDVMPHHQAERARIYFAFDIDEAMDMITTAATTGNVDYEVRSARKAIQHIDDFTEAVEEMGAASETVLATSCEVAQEHVMDGQDDQVQLPMSNDEQALLDQLDYRELAMAIDHTLDEWRQEASGCSSDGLPTDRISSTIWI